MLPRPHGVGMCPAVPGAQADQRDKGGVTPLGVLPPALRPEVERLMLRVREERELARIPSRGGASNMDPGAAAAVDPIGDAAADPGDAAVDLASGHDHDKPAGSQLQPGYQDASFPIAGPFWIRSMIQQLHAEELIKLWLNKHYFLLSMKPSWK